MAQTPGEPRRPRPSPLPFTSVRPETQNSIELPPNFPPPHRLPAPLPALPLIFQPAVIVWARIHLQHQLHGEPCPARGLRGPRAALSCPEGWGGQGSGQGWGLGPPLPGPALLRPVRCRSLGSSLKIDGPGEETAAADLGPSPSQPSPQLQAASCPSLALLRCRCRCCLPHGIRLLQSMPPAPPALPMPLSGAGVAPLPAQAFKQMAEIWAVSPQKPAPDLL